MKSKGFTLIELLAVIVILAIIALIATPIVLNIIKDSKESATLQSAEFYLGAVETAVAKKIIDEPTFKPSSCEIQEDGNLKCDETDVKIEIKGETPTSGTITLENGKIKDIQIVLNNKTMVKDKDKWLYSGLYDAEGNLIATWDELVNDYGIDIRKNYYENDQVLIKILSSNEKLSKGVKFVIDNSVTEIGNYAFHKCTSLTEIIIPNSVTSIGISAFRDCTSLSQLIIPNSVVNISVWAFSGCTSLKKIAIPNSVTGIGERTFNGCKSLSEITIPNSVTSIGKDSFANCTSLSEVEIPNSVTSIVGGVFYGCKSLKQITIPNSVTSIGLNAFEGCINLNEIVIPNSVTSIDNYAFGAQLKIINYIGTEDEWNSISFGEYWDYRILNNYTINYNYVIQ